MFNLPLSTTAVILGFPLFWIVYTVIFLWTTRSWDRAQQDRGDDA